MATVETLRSDVDRALSDGRTQDAVAYLCEIVARVPDDRQARVALAIALGDAGHPAGALKILQATANNLAHRGLLLEAMIVIRHGLAHAPQDAHLVSCLRRIHVRGVRARAGNLPSPPPLRVSASTPETWTAERLLSLEPTERFRHATEVGAQFAEPGEAAIPLPMPLFSELEEDTFIETVRQLHYRRLQAGSVLLQEGAPGSTLLVVARGHVTIDKQGQRLAKVGPGTVLGEMALITGAPRSATATAEEDIEVFELERGDIERLSQTKPKIAEELVEYCRKRLLSNLLRTSPLFRPFDDNLRFELLQRFVRQGFQPGQKLITQGQPGRGLLVIATGDVEVAVSNEGGEAVVVANLGPGDVVGEISLLNDSPTTATVTARGRVGALFLPRDDFVAMSSAHPDIRTYLESLSSDRLEHARQAQEADEFLDADELIVL